MSQSSFFFFKIIAFFGMFILSEFFSICVLSQCKVSWINLKETNTFTYKKILFHTLFWLLLKLPKAFIVTLKRLLSLKSNYKSQSYEWDWIRLEMSPRILSSLTSLVSLNVGQNLVEMCCTEIYCEEENLLWRKYVKIL